jgi:hypothetical protein
MKNFKTIIIFLTIISIFLTFGCDSTNILESEYDVIVVGTDPEGISAAISTARNGLKTLLIDDRDRVGGLFTLGWLNFLDMNYGPNNELLTKGIFEDFYLELEGIAFDVQTAEKVFNEMIENQDNITLSLSHNSISPIMDGKKIIGIKSIKDDTQFSNYANYIIDSTQDGDIAAKSGASFTLGQEDIGGPKHGMAVTQVFKLGGIKSDDWQEIRTYLKNDGDINTGSTSNTAWGFPELYETYDAHDESVQMRGLNIARQTDGCVMINALQIFYIDPLDQDSLATAKKIALDELNYIIPFLRENIPGMQDITLLSVAPELYVRESRHFNTLYKLTIDDVLEHRNFEDKIALGSYPVDLQGTAPGEDVIILGNPKVYSIPIRATVPKDIGNLFIASRSAGYDSLAHGSARVVPVGMCVAEGVGQVVSTLHNENVTIEELLANESTISNIQEELINFGAYLPDFDIEPEIMNSPYYQGLKFVRSYGLIQGRYDNNYKLNQSIDTNSFIEMFNKLNEHLDWGYQKIETKVNTELSKSALVTIFTNELKLLKELELIDVYPEKSTNKVYNKGEAIMLLYKINLIS